MSVINLIFVNAELNLKIDLPIEQLKFVYRLCEESNPYETGGIIIGNYSNDGSTAYISEILTFPADSIKEKTFFKRGIKGLKKRLDMLWNDGYYYVGEWHYHPDSIPTPSSSDIKQMISFSQNKKLNCPEPILIIIGGTKNHWLHNVIVITNETIIPFDEVN